MTTPIDRRRFLKTSAGLGAALAGVSLSADSPPARPGPPAGGALAPFVGPRRPYPDNKPRVILVRFGGGVRRQETVAAPESTYCPFIYHELYKRRGVLFSNVEIQNNPKIITSHGEGTLYLLTGKYDEYRDFGGRPLGNRYVPQVPTIPEYLRRAYDVPEHEALIVNGEDRIDEDFFTFSNCPHFGVHYRSTVLSLHRFKTFMLRDELTHGSRWLDEGRRQPLTDEEIRVCRLDLGRREAQERQSLPGAADQGTPAMNAFWERWRAYYGSSGFVNPRGDRLLTTLSLWALRELRPKFLMINYQDTDYVHWGNRSFYTRAISVIDEGVREIFQATQADPEYRDNTVFLVVPDCGRDSNRSMPIPYQHHFNTRSAREIFAVAAGPGIRPSPTAVGRPRQQAAVAATVGRLMGFPTELVDAGAGTLLEVLA